MLKLLFICLTVSHLSLPSVSQSACQTPDSHPGTCIQAKDCKSFVRIVETIPRPITASTKDQLKAYLCSEYPYIVCCPEDGQITIKNSINTHKNYHLLPEECGYIDLATTKIINGLDADLTEFPWMALLSFRESDNSRDFKCGGTIINERYILTAAHCLEEKSRLIGVRVGEYNKISEMDCYRGECNEPVQDVAVEERIPHPEFKSNTFENDIGLLRVTPIRLNDKNIKPVCLPKDDSKPINDTYLEISGWGVTKSFARTSSNVLQKAKLPVIKLNQCKQIYERYPEIKIDDRLICAGGGNNQSYACLGDSGGPVQSQEKFINGDIRYVQRGVVSLGPRKCDFQSTFTKVRYYMDWILDNMKP